MTEERQGHIYAIGAFLFWGGISTIYFKQVSSVDAFEVLLYRIVFSVITLLPFLLFKKELKTFIHTISDFKKVKYLFFSTLFASTNWLIFIWAISNNHIVEASLGYYINPLINALFGYMFFSERMKKSQYVAIGIACVAVIYELITLGTIPWISLSLGISFGLYGMMRKKVNIGSVVGLLIEVLILLPFALMAFWMIYKESGLSLFSSNMYVSWMLTLSGLITVIPLLLFNGAARRMKLTTLGFFQYIGPSVALIIAVFMYNEPFTSHDMITFGLIWTALMIFSLEGLSKRNKEKQ
jgi:chloramphenicol-sensitive protein RarD